MVVLIIFPVIVQTVINVIMLSIGGQGAYKSTDARNVQPIKLWIGRIGPQTKLCHRNIGHT